MSLNVKSSNVFFVFGPSSLGFNSLKQLFESQENFLVSDREWPLPPWVHPNPSRFLSERLHRIRGKANGAGSLRAEWIVDMATSYLPYVETTLDEQPDVKLIYLKYAAVLSAKRLMFECVHKSRILFNHWAEKPVAGWHYDPVLSPTYPKYDSESVEGTNAQAIDQIIDRYVEEYEAQASQLAAKYPNRIHVLECHTLQGIEWQKELFEFMSIPDDQQKRLKLPQAGWLNLEDDERETWASPRGASEVHTSFTSSGRVPPNKCVVLVPFGAYIHQDCELPLKELERRGYVVRRIAGYSAIDQGRNQMATDALRDGFEETLWIDSDIGFEPDDVERIRGHGLPICCGIYPQKGRRELACFVPPSTPKLVFGKEGGLVEIMYAGAGFLHIRREAYQRIQQDLNLPVCNERFGSAMVPFFQPLIREHGDANWYLAEDYAFCERARRCGLKIMADTTVRLWHVGNHRYSWENAGIDFPRYDTFTLQVHKEDTPASADLSRS